METATAAEDADGTLRRPMNAFLLFCKRHRSVVKSGHPWLDNRSCTKMLADMWAVLDWDEKSKYLQLARECKTAFMKAHPDYKWCGSNKTHSKGSGPTMRTRTKSSSCSKHAPKTANGVWAPDGWAAEKSPPTPCKISAGKLADPCDMGGLSLLLLAGEQSMTKCSASSCPDSDPQLSPKSRLFEFAEMCSDQLDLLGKAASSLDDREAPGQKVDHNANNITADAATNHTELPDRFSEASDAKERDCCSRVGSERWRHGRGTSEEAPARDESIPPCLKKEGEEVARRKPEDSAKRETTEPYASRTDVNGASSPSLATGQEANRLDPGRHGSGDEEDGEDDIDEDAGDPPSGSEAGEWSGHCGNRRKSSRSCKGRLYREYVMEGMLESLQRPERPFNCKKSWKHLEGSSLSDGDDVVFEPSPDKAKRVGRRGVRKRTVSGCGSLPSPSDFDYGEIDVEARLANLPQYSPDQFQPKGKGQRQKKSTCLYKNSTFVKRGGKGAAKKERPPVASSASRVQLAGSRKRKAPKSSIQHLTLTQHQPSPVSPSSTLSNTRQFVLNNHTKTAEKVEAESHESSSSHAKTIQSQDIGEDGTTLVDLEAKTFTHPLMSQNSQHRSQTTHAITVSPTLHCSALTVS